MATAGSIGAVFKKDRHGNLLDAGGDVVPRARQARSWSRRWSPRPTGGTGQRDGGSQGYPAPPDGHPSGEGDALRRLPLHRQRPRQRQALRRGPQRDRDRVHRLPRDRLASDRLLRTSGPASPKGGLNLSALRTPSGQKRFEKRGNVLIQNSMVDPKLSPGRSSRRSTPSTRRAGTTTRSLAWLEDGPVRGNDGRMTWGDVPRRAQRVPKRRETPAPTPTAP